METLTILYSAALLLAILVMLFLSYLSVKRKEFYKRPAGKRCRFRMNGKYCTGTVVASCRFQLIFTIKPDGQKHETHSWKEHVKPIYF